MNIPDSSCLVHINAVAVRMHILDNIIRNVFIISLLYNITHHTQITFRHSDKFLFNLDLNPFSFQVIPKVVK